MTSTLVHSTVSGAPTVEFQGRATIAQKHTYKKCPVEAEAAQRNAILPILKSSLQLLVSAALASQAGK